MVSHQTLTAARRSLARRLALPRQPAATCKRRTSHKTPVHTAIRISCRLSAAMIALAGWTLCVPRGSRTTILLEGSAGWPHCCSSRSLQPAFLTGSSSTMTFTSRSPLSLRPCRTLTRRERVAVAKINRLARKAQRSGALTAPRRPSPLSRLSFVVTPRGTHLHRSSGEGGDPRHPRSPCKARFRALTRRA